MNQVSRGDTKAGFESCDHVVEGEMRIGAQDQFCMETQSARVVPCGDQGQIDVYCGDEHTQALQVDIFLSR